MTQELMIAGMTMKELHKAFQGVSHGYTCINSFTRKVNFILDGLNEAELMIDSQISIHHKKYLSCCGTHNQNGNRFVKSTHFGWGDRTMVCGVCGALHDDLKDNGNMYLALWLRKKQVNFTSQELRNARKARRDEKAQLAKDKQAALESEYDTLSNNDKLIKFAKDMLNHDWSLMTYQARKKYEFLIGGI